MDATLQNEPSKPIERFALYYPYIHIRDSYWLKSTLLWFGQVRRIVPEHEYTPNDPPEIQSFAHTPHPDGIGSLLDVAHISEPAILEAKSRLQKQLEDHLDVLVQKYSETKTPGELRSSFQVHRNKLLDTQEGTTFPDFLTKHHLAWHPRSEADSEFWLAMHPRFGAGIMSALALAIAKNEGLGIVTCNGNVHNTLLAERESDVLNAMLGLPRAPTVPGVDLADDLAQLVFTTQFDLSALTAKDIQTLIEEKKDLAQFRKRVTDMISDIPVGIGLDERVKRLKTREKDILEEWNMYRACLPTFVKKALAEAAFEESVKKAAEHSLEIIALVGSAAASSTTATVLAGAPGFALSILAGAGLKMWRTKASSMRFLSRVDSAIQKSCKQRSASLLLPQWGKFGAV